MSRRFRRRFYVDKKVQGALVVRALMYWLYFILSASMMLLAWRLISNTPANSGEFVKILVGEYGFPLVASLVVLPLVVNDLVRFTNRFAGPMYRLRKTVKALANGEPATPIHFRDNDFWPDFAEDVNRIIAMVEAKGEGKPAADIPDEESELVQS